MGRVYIKMSISVKKKREEKKNIKAQFEQLVQVLVILKR